MAKLIKSMKGVVKGEIYHREFSAGDECPVELEAAALELGALPRAKGGKKGAPASGDSDVTSGDDDTAGDDAGSKGLENA